MRPLAISISGGGALGIGPLAFMTRMEQDFKKKISDMSFAYAGTSTGSIIAAGLEEGKSAHELFDLYRENLKPIFNKFPWYKSILPKCPKYDNTYLSNLLKKVFPGKIGEWKKPIYIPATFMNGESVEKVWDLGDADTDKAFAVLTSCSAPHYFDVIVRDGKSFCDGGLWCNDPTATLQSGLTKSGHGNYKILCFNSSLDTPNTACGNMTTLGWGEYMLNEWIARTGKSNYYETAANIGSENVFRASPFHSTKIEMDDTSDTTLNHVIELWQNYYETMKPQLEKFISR